MSRTGFPVLRLAAFAEPQLTCHKAADTKDVGHTLMLRRESHQLRVFKMIWGGNSVNSNETRKIYHRDPLWQDVSSSTFPFIVQLLY